jgi:hypothetical protein
MNLPTHPQSRTRATGDRAPLSVAQSVGPLIGLLLQLPMRMAYAKSTYQLASAPHPVDVPRGYGRGPDPDRVLLLSSKDLAGSGVVSHQLGLAGKLADEMSRATRRGTDVDLSLHQGRRIRSAPGSIRGNDLRKYHAVVIALGERDALAFTAPRRWSSWIESLLTQIRDRSLAGTPIVVTGILNIRDAPGRSSRLTKLAQDHAARLNRATESVCARANGATFVPVEWTGPSAVRRMASEPAEPARYIARHLAARLPTPQTKCASPGRTARSVRSSQQSAHGRRQALTDLGITLTRPDEAIDRLVKLARAYFRTEHAALVLLDDNIIRFKSKAGFRGNPNMSQLTGPTIDTGCPVFVGNSQPIDPDLHPLHVGGVRMGFYAGYPVETPDGHRVGVLSVFDRKPRPTQVSDTVLMRDLAMLLQRELWATRAGAWQ